MHFCSKLCNHLVAGGGFWHTGADNIIEELQLHKPVTVGSKISINKFPAFQAKEPCLLKVIQDPAELTSNFSLFLEKNTANKISRDKFERFLKVCSGLAKRR